jgi:hypothetical protein
MVGMHTGIASHHDYIDDRPKLREDLPDKFDTATSGLYKEKQKRVLNYQQAARESLANVQHKSYLGLMVRSDIIYKFIQEATRQPSAAPSANALRSHTERW